MKHIHTRKNIGLSIIVLRNLTIGISVIGARKKIAMLSSGKYKEFFLNTLQVFKSSNVNNYRYKRWFPPIWIIYFESLKNLWE
jgi:hypothetical protein